MADWGEFVRNMKFRTKPFEVLIVKLPTIVSDDGVWQIEFAYDWFLNEFFYFTFGNLYQRFSFYLFGEVVDSNHNEFPLSRCWGKKTEYFNFSLCEGPWCKNLCKLASQLVLDIRMFLTWLTPSDNLSCIFLHDGSIISLSQDLIS